MTVPKWLNAYYGKDFDILNPSVYLEGREFAVVTLKKTGTRLTTSTGYVLIRKSGNHQTSTSVPLHEGVITADAVEKMKKALAKAEEHR